MGFYFVTVQAEWDADETDCQGKTRIKTDFFNSLAFLLCFCTIFK